MTQHQQWAYMERSLQTLIENQPARPTIRKGSTLCRSSRVEAISGKKSSHEREQFAFSKTVLASHIKYKNEIILAPDGVSENGFLLERKYLSMKGVFLGEKHILDNVGMSLASAQQTQTRVRSRTDVFGRQALGLGKTVGSGEKKKKFPFLVFRAIPVKSIGAPTSRFQLPSVKDVFR
jgi:hypothetical protein